MVVVHPIVWPMSRLCRSQTLVQLNVVLFPPQGFILLQITNSVQISNKQDQTQPTPLSWLTDFERIISVWSCKTQLWGSHPSLLRLHKGLDIFREIFYQCRSQDLCWAANPTSRKYVPPCLIILGWGSLTEHSLAISRNARWALCMRRGPWGCKWNFTLSCLNLWQEMGRVVIYIPKDPMYANITNIRQCQRFLPTFAFIGQCRLVFLTFGKLVFRQVPLFPTMYNGPSHSKIKTDM